MSEFNCIASDVRLGKGVKLAKFINLYGCEIGDDSKVGAFVEIQKNARVGARCKISSHTFICEGVTIEDNVFVGHGVVFINDMYPRATNSEGELQAEKDWRVEPTLIKTGASIGSGSTILANVTIGKNAIVGAGSVVTKNVPANAIVAGNPARMLRNNVSIKNTIATMTNTDNIPFLDLITPHTELMDEICSTFRTALETASFVNGPMVQGFEHDFAAFCDAPYCIGVSSGTDAIRFALIAAGVERGDAVITVPNTFIATTEAISQAEALPVFVDVDERTHNLDPKKLREYIETHCEFDPKNRSLFVRKTKSRVAAVIPVHLYGQAADMDPILELAEQYNLIVIEDACQAHGAEYFSKRQNRWRKAGSMGKAAAFSFYPGKNLGACGEAGAVTTGDAELAQKVRMLRDHGQAQKYYHDLEGYNGRLDAIQAGILRVKLRHLAEWTEMRRAAAARYEELFADSDAKMILPYEPAWTKPVYHLYVVRVENRAELIKHLTSVGIGAGIHYPIPLHLQKAYEPLGYQKGDFPVAERLATEIVSLPMFPQLRADQQNRIGGEVLKCVVVEKMC